MAQLVPRALSEARYIALTTYRRDGRAVTTPVWPVVVGSRLLVGTIGGSGKVKRLRNDPRIRLAPCNASGSRILGDWHEGRARILTDADTLRAVDAARWRKYHLQQLAVTLIYRVRGWFPHRVVLEIEITDSATTSDTTADPAPGIA